MALKWFDRQGALALLWVADVSVARGSLQI
jgi:hypothetical protein